MSAVTAGERSGRELPRSTPRPSGRATFLRARLRSVAPAEWIALLAALAPIVTTVVRAAAVGWMPLYDAGYFAARSRDVFTEHHPLVGAWSMGSKTIGESLNNLGPLQLDLLAPFTKLWPYWGTALGTGIINAAAVVGVWFAARRMFGQRGAVGAMVATLCLEATMGSWMLVEARQQLALLLPLWCVLWLGAAVFAGGMWALPPLAFASSLVVQTHFSFVYQALAVLAVALVGLELTGRAEGWPRRWRRPLIATVAVLAICWVQPLLDQFFGNGNLATVLSERGGGAQAVGWSDGVRYVAGSTLAPPFWSPGYIGEYLRPDVPMSTTAAWLTVAAWAAAVAAVVLIGPRFGRRPIVALGVVGLAVLAGALYAASRIPPTEFGIVAFNYYWMWPIGIFLTVAILAALLSLPMVRRALRPAPTWAVAGVCLLASIPVLRPVNYLPETADEPEAGGRVGGPLMDQFGDSLDRLGIEGPIVIDRSRETHTNYFPYTLLVELQRRDIPFTFPPGDISIARFGEERCEKGTASHRIILADGAASASPKEGEHVLARVDGLSDEDHAELVALGEDFGELIRDGTVSVDMAGFEFFGQPPSPLLVELLDDPSLPATGLARYLDNWQLFGVVEVPDELTERFSRWYALEERAVFDRVALFLAPNLVNDDRCDVVEPGENQFEPLPDAGEG